MDEVNIDYYHEAQLAERLGYSLFCRVEDIDTDLVVRETRMVSSHNTNLEVRILEGWRKPLRCWATGDGTMKVKTRANQRGLFA